MANDIRLGDYNPLAENPLPLKVADKVSSLELSEQGNRTKINGDLEVVGQIKAPVMDSAITNSIVSTDLTIDDSGDIILDADGGNIYFKDGGVTYIDFQVDGANDKMAVTGALTIDASGNITLDSGSGYVKLEYDGTSAGQFIMDTTNGGAGARSLTLQSGAGAGTYLILDAAGATNGALQFESEAGNFIMSKGGDEFSAANSAYAGMILGYTAIGIDATFASEAIGNSFAVTDATHKVTFTAPPSGNVEIYLSVYADQVSSGRWLQLGLSDNATYNTLDVTHEHFAAKGDETDEEQLHHEWVITGLTAGTEYEYWLGAKAQSAGAYNLYWGGNVTAKFQPFVMKATALPATIYTG